MSAQKKRTISVDLTAVAGGFMAELSEGESGDHASKWFPYSPDEHPEFDSWIGAELYDWITFMCEEEGK